jgi:hypothetical protein
VGSVVLAEDGAGALRGDVLVEVVVYQRHWGGSAARETLDELDAELAVGAHRRGVAVRRGLGIDAGGLAEGFTHLVATGQRAGERAADADADATGLLLAEPGIEGDEFEDIDRLEVEAFRDPLDAALVDESEMVLPEVEKRKGSAPLGNRIVGHRLVDFGKKVRGDLIGLTGTGGRCSMRAHEEWKETKKVMSRKAGNARLKKERTSINQNTSSQQKKMAPAVGLMRATPSPLRGFPSESLTRDARLKPKDSNLQGLALARIAMLSMAPAVGFEPTTNRLTADRSTTELRWINRAENETPPATLMQLKKLFVVVKIETGSGCRLNLVHNGQNFPRRMSFMPRKPLLELLG